MKITSELLLTFLLNAGWEILLIAAAATLGDRLLRRTVAGYRHLVWVAALALSLLLPLVPLISSVRAFAFAAPAQRIEIAPVRVVDASVPLGDSIANRTTSAFHINRMVAFGLIGLYALFLGYRFVKLCRAWIRTRSVARDARPLALEGEVEAIVANCQIAIGAENVTFLSSASLRVPAALGIFRPRVILPEGLLRDANTDALTAAIGHELAHVRRHDYLLNLIYELIFLPLSFHPAAALIRRRITQTRELRCDELVAEQLLHPEVYARSLVQLAGSAVPFSRRAQTITVGIADADILEVRIMSLLKGRNTGKKRLWLIAAALLLAIPCAAAASFAFHFNVDPAAASLSPQDPSREAQEKKEMREKRAREEREAAEREDQALRQRIETETNQEVRAKLEATLQRRLEERANKPYVWTVQSEGAAREREIEASQKAELARAAKISMDQAIQIARSQQPGKVLECSLVGERWEEPGKLGKNSLVLYHVVMVSGDEANPTTTHVLVNAVDGTIVKTEREERRQEAPTYPRTERAPISGGVLNGKAVELPLPEYPDIARAAHAEGAVTVQITIDEDGNVIAAKAVSGHPLLQAAAVRAAREARFTPTRLQGEPVQVNGVIIYNFVAQ